MDASLNVYNWSDYIAKDTIANFEKQSGITVKYDSYDSDGTLQANLLAGCSGCDIVVPTSSYLARQIEAGVYQKIDRPKMPNLANLDPGLMKLIADADPGNQYGVPWAWGSAEITNEVFYPTANRAARQYVSPAVEQENRPTHACPSGAGVRAANATLPTKPLTLISSRTQPLQAPHARNS